MGRRMLVAGNWKMNGTGDELVDAEAIANGAADHSGVDVALCLPATLIERAARKMPNFSIGGQDVHAAEKGAHTGDISTAMLRDAGASVVIVGHSERREAHGESNSDVRAKAEAALAAGLDVIVCCGESHDVREAGKAVETVCAQIDASLPQGDGSERISVAYEPIWAIGTGKVASVEDIAEMHDALRGRLSDAYGQLGERLRLLYGGSVKAGNAAEIFSVGNVDGALVGGASLKAEDFLPIVEAAAQSGS